MADRHLRAARYGDHPPTCTCESCSAKRRGEPDPKELRRAKHSLTPESALEEAEGLFAATHARQNMFEDRERREQEQREAGEGQAKAAAADRERDRLEAQQRLEQRQAAAQTPVGLPFTVVETPTAGQQAIIESRGRRYSPRYEIRLQKWRFQRWLARSRRTARRWCVRLIYLLIASFALLSIYHVFMTGEIGAGFRMATEDVRLVATCPTKFSVHKAFLQRDDLTFVVAKGVLGESSAFREVCAGSRPLSS